MVFFLVKEIIKENLNLSALCGHTVAMCYKVHGYPSGYKIQGNSHYNADKAKGKFPENIGVHMVYTTPSEHMQHDQNHSVSQPHNHIVSYNGTN